MPATKCQDFDGPRLAWGSFTFAAIPHAVGIGSFNRGGGIFNRGVLNISGSLITANTATNIGSGTGGGLYQTTDAGTAQVQDTTSSANSAGTGGAISNAADLLLENCTLSGNSGDGTNPLATDQRGFGRIQDGNGDGIAAIDIGAVEKGRLPADEASNVLLDTNLVIDFGAGVQKGTTPESFQYPTFHEHEGTIWLTVTQSDHRGSTDRIMFGKLADVGRFESQAGKTRKPLPTPPEEPAVMNLGTRLFTDRDYVIQEMPKQVRSLPFLRTSIEKIDVEVTKAGTLYAMTPTVRPKAASQEETLKQAGFTKVEVPEVQLFPGEINRVSLYRKDVKSGERLSFKKMVLLIFDKGTEVKVVGASATPAPATRAPDDMPASVRPDLKWSAQATEDAKQDFTSIPYDGITPNKLVCDTTLRELPDGSWALFMLAGDDFEPSPKNYTGLTRSFDKGRTWTPLQAVDIGLSREGKTMGQGPTELMTIGNRSLLFFSTHSQTWGRDWQSWFIHRDDNCQTWSQPQPVPGRLDGGKTWTEHGNIRLTPDDRYHGWAENNLAELGDGRIAMIIRADRLGGVLYYAESKDGGTTWPEFAVKSDIPNPGSKATL